MRRTVLILCAMLPVAAHSQDTNAQDTRWDIPPLVEVDALDPPSAAVRRFAFTARGVMAQEFALPNSQGLFCRLSNQHNLELNYYPASDEWIFQVQSNASAQLAAGGIAICETRKVAP